MMGDFRTNFKTFGDVCLWAQDRKKFRHFGHLRHIGALFSFKNMILLYNAVKLS